MKSSQRLLAILFILATLPAQAGWFSDDADYVAICKTKALKIKSKAAITCATEGDEEACAAQKAMEKRQYDEEGCKAISIAHKKLTDEE